MTLHRPEFIFMYQWILLLIVIFSQLVEEGAFTTTPTPITSTPTVGDVTIDPPGNPCDSVPADYCKNNGTCHQPPDDELWECSGDAGIGPLKCDCPSSYTGSRCETKRSCDSLSCKLTESCDFNWNKQILECIPTNTSGQPPTCRSGVQEIPFQFDPANLGKTILCLDMYEFNTSSLCNDPDDSLTYFISDRPQELPFLFCLVVDYQEYKTCLRVNATHRYSITMTSAEVTIMAEEYSILSRTAPLKLRVYFNTPPSVQNSVISWVANTAEIMTLDVIAEAQATDTDTDKTELKLSDISLSNNDIVRASVKNKSNLQLDIIGAPTFQMKRIRATIKIKDSGTPQLSTNVTIQITLVRLDCQPISTLLIDRSKLKVGTTFPIGQTDCRGTPGYGLNYDTLSGIPTGLSIRVNSDNVIVLEVNEIITSPVSETGSSSLIVSFNKLPSVRKTLNFNYDIYFYSLIWFERGVTTGPDPPGTGFESETNVIKEEIEKHISDKVSIHFVRLRVSGEGSWFDVLLKSNSSSNLTTDETAVKNELLSGQLGSIPIKTTSVNSTSQLNHIFNPMVTINGRDKNIMQGSSVVVNCEVKFINVFEKADIFWTLNGIRIQPLSTSRFQISSTTGNSWELKSTLRINDIKKTDRGSLGCHVRDIYGLEKTSSLNLPVISLPIVSVPETVFVRADREIELICTVVFNGSDTTTLKWLNEGSEVESGAVLKLSTNVDTERSCVGSNKAGQGQAMVVKIFIIAGAACTSETDSRNTAWFQATAGKVSRLPCPSGYEGTVTRKCGDDGFWLEPSYKDCIQSSLVNLQDEITQLESGILVSTPDNIMSNMSAITKQTTLNSGEVVVMTEALKDLTTILESRVANNTEIQQDTVTRWASEAVKLVGNLIDPKQTIEDVKIENTSVSLLLLNTMDDVSKLVGSALSEGETTSITSDNIVLTVGKVDPFNLVNVSYPGNQSSQTSTLSVDLPSDIFISDIDLEAKTYSIIDYDNLTSLPVDTSQKLQNSSSTQAVFQMNSDVVSVNIFGESFNPDKLTAEVAFTFSHLNSSLNSAACSFWNVDLSAWDNTGCRLLSTNQTSTTCSCNHLTNFAVLMKPTQVSLTDEEILSTITLVGATISIFCLLVTLLVYAFVWRYVRSDRAKLLVNLCVALIIALVLFLFGVDKTENQAVCTAMAVCLHYFYLVVFFLMLGEGIEVLVTIVKVFSSRSKLREIVLMGWGIPAVIVAISAGVTELEGYGNSKFCWLSIDGGLIWAFLGPALFIIFVNVIIVIKITYALLNTRVMINKDTRIKAKAALRSICVLLPVMGVSWVFGVLSVNQDLVVFDYIFSIFNSLQGLFIFIFHCVINRKVREGLANRRRRYRSRHTSLSAQKSGSRSIFDKSRNSRKPPSDDETRHGMILKQSQGQDNAGYFSGHRMEEIPRKKPIERLRYPSFDGPRNYLNHFPEVSEGYSNLSVSEDPGPIIPNQSLVQSGLNQEFFKPAVMRGNSGLSAGFSDRSGSSNSEDLSVFKGLPRPKLYF